MLVDFELDKQQLDNAIALFSECLLMCHHVPLWLSYMRFIKMVRIYSLREPAHRIHGASASTQFLV